MLKNFISKEVFKTYYGGCKKLALAMADISILKKMIKFEKEKQIKIINLDRLTEKYEQSKGCEDDTSSTAPINPILDFAAYFSKNDDVESKEKIEILRELCDDENIDIFNSIVSANITDGEIFGQLVRDNFMIKNENINITESKNLNADDLNHLTLNEALKETKKIMDSKKTRFLFEGAFVFEEKLKVRPDVLEILSPSVVNIFEAKGSTFGNEKKEIKKEHILDLAYQVYVLKKCGVLVYNANLCYINRDYCRTSEDIDFYEEAEKLKEKVKTKDISFNIDVKPILGDLLNKGIKKIEKAIDALPKDIVKIVNENKYYTSLNKILEPIIENMDVLISKIDFDIEAVKKSDEKFLDYFKTTDDCWKLTLKRKVGTPTISKSYCGNILPYFDDERANIQYLLSAKNLGNFISRYGDKYYISDFEVDELLLTTKDEMGGKNFFSYKYPWREKIALINKKENNEQIRDEELLIQDKEVFDSAILPYLLGKPIYMYDFETSSWAVPVFDKQVPYDQTVFQYSIDIIESLDDIKGGTYKTKHFGWLKSEQEDPRQEFLFNFIRDSFAAGPGVYVSYNKSFEIGVLRKLAVLFPEYKIPLMYICQNTIDMLDFFKQNIIYHPLFKKSNSIKYTQPALYPKLQYSDLVVNKGDKASFMFKQYINDLFGDDSRKVWKEVHYKPMLDYCNRDTEAMVVLFMRIYEIKLALEAK